MSSLPNRIEFQETPTRDNLNQNGTLPTKKVSPKLKHSMFLVTVNTNTIVDPQDPWFSTFKDRFRRALDDIYSQPQKFVSFKEEGKDWDEKYIKKYKREGYLEIGSQHHKLHSHHIILISHYTKIHLSRPAIVQAINAALGYQNKSVHVNIRWIRYKVSDEINVKEYVKKYYNDDENNTNNGGAPANPPMNQ